MKRRILTVLLALAICFTGVINWDINVNAETESESISIEELMTDDALIGYAELQTWGVYFSDGYSIINKISSTKIGAGGVTNANVKCTVAVTSILERKTDAGWARVTSWSQTNNSAYSAMVSRSVTVATGYYYRVRSYHYASSDSATSSTNALWMGN